MTRFFRLSANTSACSLDDAIVTLKADDREAVLLRFFEKRSFTEVGAALQVTEEAARKRVDRALEKLRAALHRRGITSTSAALDIALTAGAATSVPAGLGAKVAENVLAATSVVAGGATFGGWLGFVLPTAAGLVIGGLALIQRHANEEVRGTLSQFAADHAALVSLQIENRELTRTLAETDALRRAAETGRHRSFRSNSEPMDERDHGAYSLPIRRRSSSQLSRFMT